MNIDNRTRNVVQEWHGTLNVRDVDRLDAASEGPFGGRGSW